MCECEECQRSVRVQKTRDFLELHDQKELLENLAELYDIYAHDHDVLKAMVDNIWPSAEGYMKKRGLVRG